MTPPTNRRRWTCPRCGTKWEIPAAAPDPRDCPECQKVDKLNAGRVVRVGRAPKGDLPSSRHRKNKVSTGALSVIVFGSTLAAWPICVAAASFGLYLFAINGETKVGKEHYLINGELVHAGSLLLGTFVTVTCISVPIAMICFAVEAVAMAMIYNSRPH